MNVVQRSLAVPVAAAALLVGAAPAGAAIDPSASAVLAGALKPAMKTKLKKLVPGLVITKVTCFVPTTSNAISGKCTARFTVAKYRLDGVYRAKATLSSRGRLTWTTTSNSCTDARTHQRASCTGESSTGNGLISARDAEAQLIANGFVYQGKAMRAKSAVCRGSKSAKWQRGEFDDVFARLQCDLRAADGGAYRVVFLMTGPQGYRLGDVTKGT